MKRTTKTRLTFESEGEALVGNLFLPEGAEPAGIVVAVGPLTSVKEQAPGAYARAMAARGYAALAFDYRYFGESGGQPRQFENPDANIEDIRNAASALLADDRLKNLPIAGLGICFGAGPMVSAVARDPRFSAFAGVAGVYTDNAKTVAGMGPAYRRRSIAVALLNADIARQVSRRSYPRSGPMGAMSPCRYRRRMSTTGRRAALCPTTSTATRSSRWRTACRLTRAAQRARSRCRC
jgi:uncharacterized protein